MIEIKVRAQDGRMLLNTKCASNNKTRYKEILEILHTKYGFGPTIPFAPNKRGNKSKKPIVLDESEFVPDDDFNPLDLGNNWFKNQ